MVAVVGKSPNGAVGPGMKAPGILMVPPQAAVVIRFHIRVHIQKKGLT